MIYLLIAVHQGVDGWRFSVTEDEPGTVEANVVSWPVSIGGFSAVPVYPGVPMIVPSPPSGPMDEERFYVSPPLYKLFYDRMDYFLNLRDTWEPCPKKIDKSEYIFAGGLEYGDDPLCLLSDATDPTKKTLK